MTVKSLDDYRTHRRSLKGARILVVDDESTVRMIVRQFLINAGYSVTVAVSGEEALLRLDENSFDLVLLDILMPNMGGHKVLETLRRRFSKSEMAVIIVTAKEDSADMLKAFSLGANDYVLKPIDFAVLRTRMELHLSHQRAEKELREAQLTLEQRVDERTVDLLAANKALVAEISERRRIEEQLNRSHVLYSQAESMGKLGHWEWDHVSKKMISCSEQLARSYEMTVEETLAFFSSWENELSIIHPLDRDRYEQHIIETEEQQISTDIEYRIITRSGITRHIHLRSDYVINDENKVILSFGVEQDITERKLADAELRKSHSLFNHAEKMGKLGHWEWDVIKEKLSFCSEQYAEIFEMNAEGIYPSLVHSFDIDNYIHEDDRERYRQVTEDAYEHKQAWDIEFRIITRNGKNVHLRELGEPVLDDYGTNIKTFGILQDITERKMAEEEIRHLAYHDELTGLPTFRLGKDRLANAIALTRRSKKSVAVLFLDLDGFKEVNDSMGHKAGDHVLVEVSSRMTKNVRETDTVARIGGDEFIIILTALDDEEIAVKMAEKIIDALKIPVDIDGQQVKISTSIGIALSPDHGKLPDELINKADKAMYAVKHGGKNNYLVAK
jgi:diguanylate cyclase (GGDEF)-like protein